MIYNGVKQRLYSLVATLKFYLFPRRFRSFFSSMEYSGLEISLAMVLQNSGVQSM